MYEAAISCERTVFFSCKNTTKKKKEGKKKKKIKNSRNSSLDCSVEGVTFCQRGGGGAC